MATFWTSSAGDERIGAVDAAAARTSTFARYMRYWIPVADAAGGNAQHDRHAEVESITSAVRHLRSICSQQAAWTSPRKSIWVPIE